MWQGISQVRSEEKQMAKLAFLGLGVMGGPMAGHLQKAGHDVTVYNRTAAKAEAWVTEYGGASAAIPREAASGASATGASVSSSASTAATACGIASGGPATPTTRSRSRAR